MLLDLMFYFKEKSISLSKVKRKKMIVLWLRVISILFYFTTRRTLVIECVYLQLNLPQLNIFSLIS